VNCHSLIKKGGVCWMSSRKVLSLLVAVLFGLIMAGVAAAADKGPETITFKCEKKGDVVFSHAKHQESATCGDCHHSETDGKQVPYAEGQKIEKCGTCHTAEMAAPALNSSKKALHKNCKGCHMAAVKEGKTAAPTKCAGCHPPKAAAE
jgi:c(7)-type cytochrome triheme protein